MKQLCIKLAQYKILLRFLGGVLFVLGMIFQPALSGIILQILGTLLLAAISFGKKYTDTAFWRSHTRGTFSNKFYWGLSTQDIALCMLAKALQQPGNAGLRSKGVLLRKTVCALVAGPVLAVLLFASYHLTVFPTVFQLLLLVTLGLWNRWTPERVLLKKAKRHPYTDFSELVSQALYDEHATHKAVHRRFLGLGTAALLLILFFSYNSQPKMAFTPTDGGMALTYYQPAVFEMTEASIPETAEGKPVVAIGEKVFQNMAYLETVQLPDTVQTIGSRAFKGCPSLTAVSLPQRLTSLGGEAFMGCSSLAHIRIPQGVTELRGSTFQNCTGLTSVQLHDDITAIHAYCFQSCSSLESIRLPAKIREIRTYTFEGCSSLRQVELPVGVTRIASHAFHNCTSLAQVSVPDTLVEIGSSAFRNCKVLKTVTLPQGVVCESNAFKESPTRIKYK